MAPTWVYLYGWYQPKVLEHFDGNKATIPGIFLERDILT